MFPLILLKRKDNRCEIFLGVCLSWWVPETQSGVSFFPMLRWLVSKQDWLNIHSHCIYCDPVKTTKIAVRCSLVSVYLVPETEAQVSFPALRWLQNFKTRLTQHLAPFWPLSTPLDGSVYFVTAPDICNFSPAALFIVLKLNKRCCNDPSPDRRSTSQIAFSRFQMNIGATSLVQWPTWNHYNLHSWRYSCRQSKTVSSLTLESNYWTQEHNICSLTFVRMNLFKMSLLLLFANLSSGLQHRRCWLA